jgi:hypothetical protein
MNSIQPVRMKFLEGNAFKERKGMGGIGTVVVLGAIAAVAYLFLKGRQAPQGGVGITPATPIGTGFALPPTSVSVFTPPPGLYGFTVGNKAASFQTSVYGRDALAPFGVSDVLTEITTLRPQLALGSGQGLPGYSSPYGR